MWSNIALIWVGVLLAALVCAFIDRLTGKPSPERTPRPIQPRTYGQRVGNLTKFGETWLDLANIEAIEFNPADPICEIQFTSGQVWRVPAEDAECLKAYLADRVEQRKSTDAEWEMGKLRGDKLRSEP